MSDFAIKAENISKAYRLGEIGTGTISRDLERTWARLRGKEDPFLKIGEANDRATKGTSDVVWSLKDINFEIKQGEAVGIIGRNGAGKSTLLKILSRVTAPTTGQITGTGRIASLLEVGTGFHPELTGRENIFLNGAILGMRKHEIKRKFDEIVDFSGVERYVDTPVKRYSSGMYVRLAFAVAAHLESEILIVDEVLAVGDAEFQKKCIGKMDQVSKGEGRTILFVSHNISAVRDLCTSGLYLKNGGLFFSGNINNVITSYVESVTYTNSWKGINGSSEITIRETSVTNDGVNSDFLNKPFHNNEDIYVCVDFSINENIHEFGAGFVLRSGEGAPVARVFFNDYTDVMSLKIGNYRLKFKIPCYTLATGRYLIDFDISIPNKKKINDDSISLSFEISALSLLGDRYNSQNTPTFNSIVRPNWFFDLSEVSQ